jgi:hypothetical protein
VTANPFPERLALAPHHSLLARGPGARQFGLHPRGGVTVEGLPPELTPLVDGLRVPSVSVEWIGRAAELGVPHDYSVALLTGLLERGVLVDAAAVERRATRRSAASVEVRGMGPLAAAVAAGLVRAGVGTVRVPQAREQAGPVEAAGRGGAVGAGPGPAAARGARPRAAAVPVGPGRDSGPSGPGSARTGGGAAGAGAEAGGRGGGPRPLDLVVLADSVVVPEEVSAALHAEGVDHLPVLLRDGLGVVGPLVLPGRSPCLRCVELGRADRDPAWPTVATQITGRGGSAEPETVSATAALGVAQALVHLDGQVRPPSLGAAVELDLHAGLLVRRVWQGHPACLCGLAGQGSPRRTADVTCAGTDGRERIMG